MKCRHNELKSFANAPPCPASHSPNFRSSAAISSSPLFSPSTATLPPTPHPSPFPRIQSPSAALPPPHSSHPKPSPSPTQALTPASSACPAPAGPPTAAAAASPPQQPQLHPHLQNSTTQALETQTSRIQACRVRACRIKQILHVVAAAEMGRGKVTCLGGLRFLRVLSCWGRAEAGLPPSVSCLYVLRRWSVSRPR